MIQLDNLCYGTPLSKSDVSPPILHYFHLPKLHCIMGRHSTHFHKSEYVGIEIKKIKCVAIRKQLTLCQHFNIYMMYNAMAAVSHI